MPGDLSLPVMLATGILPGLGARRAPGPAWHPSSLFEGVIGGFWFDFTDADKLRQTSIGGQPVAAASDPVGLAFDVSRWGGKTFDEVMAARPELVTNWNDLQAADWNLGAGWTVQGGKLIRAPGQMVGSSSDQGSKPIKAGNSYHFEADVESSDGNFAFAVNSPGSDATSPAGLSVGVNRFVITATAARSRFGVTGVGSASGVFKSFSVKNIPDNHAAQPSSSQRPTYQTTHVRGDGSDDRLITAQNPTLAGTLIYAGTFEAASDVAIGATGAGGVDRCMLRISADGYLQASIGDEASAIIGETDIRGVDGVYAVRWGGAGEAVKLTRGNAVEYAGEQVGSVTTAFPFLVGAANVAGSATGFLDGKMRHCLFIPRAISDSELAQAVSYFS